MSLRTAKPTDGAQASRRSALLACTALIALLSPALAAGETGDGTVSQGGRSAPLGAGTDCDFGAMQQGRASVCSGLSRFGIGDGRLSVRVPGDVRVRLVVPMRVLRAGSFQRKAAPGHELRRTVATVAQTAPSEATIRYGRLRVGEVAWFTARFKGETYEFFFIPDPRERG